MYVFNVHLQRIFSIVLLSFCLWIFYSISIFWLALGLGFLVNSFWMMMWYLMVFRSFCAPLTLALLFIPPVLASPEFASFPSIPFKDFSDFILENFDPAISLPTVITVSLSITNNTELLSLHFKQSKNGGSTAWIRCLTCALKNNLGMRLQKLYSYLLNCLYFQTQ